VIKRSEEGFTASRRTLVPSRDTDAAPSPKPATRSSKLRAPSTGQNLALTVLFVLCSLDSGRLRGTDAAPWPKPATRRFLMSEVPLYPLISYERGTPDGWVDWSYCQSVPRALAISPTISAKTCRTVGLSCERLLMGEVPLYTLPEIRGALGNGDRPSSGTAHLTMEYDPFIKSQFSSRN